MDRETKSFSCKQAGDEGTGLAVIATFNVRDRDGDVTLPGAFGDQPVRVIMAHDWQSIVLGKGRISETKQEAVVDFKLNLGISAARDLHSALKFDLANEPPLQEWSYGYEPLESEAGEFEGEQVRFLKKVKVFEVSPVLVGAGVGTATLDIKSGWRFRDELRELQSRVAAMLDRANEIAKKRAEAGQSFFSSERLAAMESLSDALIELETVGKELRGFLALGPFIEGREPELLDERASLAARASQTLSRAQRALRSA